MTRRDRTGRWEWTRHDGDVPSLVGYWSTIHSCGFELRVTRYPHRWTWGVRWRRPGQVGVTIASGRAATVADARRAAEAWPASRVGRACVVGLLEEEPWRF